MTLNEYTIAKVPLWRIAPPAMKCLSNQHCPKRQNTEMGKVADGLRPRATESQRQSHGRNPQEYRPRPCVRASRLTLVVLAVRTDRELDDNYLLQCGEPRRLLCSQSNRWRNSSSQADSLVFGPTQITLGSSLVRTHQPKVHRSCCCEAHP